MKAGELVGVPPRLKTEALYVLHVSLPQDRYSQHFAGGDEVVGKVLFVDAQREAYRLRG